jgi:HSP20 family molecular chaperone IbpA
MSRLQLFSSPLLLGFDALEQLVDRTSKSASDSYPPYNIERSTPDGRGTESFRISLAVAGFSRCDIEITLQDRQLVIKGRQSDEKAKDFLHRGIANRAFMRTFLLADGIDVTKAQLENGLLAIDLLKSIPDRMVKHIEISE